MMKLVVVALAVLAMFGQGVPAQPKGQAACLDRLEQLDSAKWAEATASLNRAIDEDEENAGYDLARGVSSVLAEDFESVMASFDRVLRLKPDDKDHKAAQDIVRSGGVAGAGASRSPTSCGRYRSGSMRRCPTADAGDHEEAAGGDRADRA